MITLMIDIDDTVIPLISLLLPLYNAEYNDNLHIADITDYNVRKFIKPECTNLFKYCTTDFFKNIKIDDDIIEVLTWLNNHPNYQIYFLTAGHPKTMQGRDKMLSNNLPWYKSEQLIMCRHKQLLKCDALIDDCAANFVERLDCVPNFIIDKPWNANVTPLGAVRLSKLSDIKQYLV